MKRKPPEKCKKCGKPQDGSIVFCHYQGQYSHMMGKGRGVKPDDFFSIPLCFECHDIMDDRAKGDFASKMDKDLYFVVMILMDKFNQG